jgi:AAA15 family ATPase/GTPase
LEDIDIPVTEIEVSGSNESEVSNTSKEGRSALKAVVNRQDDSREMTLTHRTALGEAKFDFEEESSGTKNLIGFWLPWSVLSSSFGSSMPVLWVDELDSSLHPELVAQLVRQLIATDNGAQLIFTTHDTHLMNAKLLRRDQFWITERDINGATRLNSIHDFEGREGEDIEKRYFEGRYRGLPIIKTR